jgi:hypothetical protein
MAIGCDNWALYWRLATSSGGLAKGNFFVLGLPPPNTPNYQPYTQIFPQSQGGQTQQGYENLAVLWDDMDYIALKALSDIVDAALTAGTIYITFDRAHGIKLANDFVDASGKPGILEFQPISNGRGVVAANVVLRVNNLTILNDPSTVL